MKLSLRTKTAYGLMSIADQCLYFMFGTFFLFFTTTVVGLAPTVAGFIAAFGAVWDSICSAFIGHISDNIRCGFGKRRIFILLAAIPMGIVTVLLFTQISGSACIKNTYYFVMTLLFWTGFSSFFIPLLAWGAELSEDYGERVKLRGFAYAGNTFGMAVGVVLPSVLVEKFEMSGSTTGQAWQFTAVLVAAIVVFVLMAGSLAIKSKGEITQVVSKGSESTLKSFVTLKKLMPFNFLLISAVAYLIANTVFVADRLYYYTYNMGLSGVQISILMAVEPFAGFIFLPIMSYFSSRYDKRTQFVVGMSICGITMVLLHIIGVTTFFSASLMLVAFGLGAVCYWQMMPAMFYDICELDELVNGVQRQGAIVSFQAISESLSEALGLFMLGQMLKFSGFNGEVQLQSELTLDWLKNGFMLIPGIFMLISAFMVYKYPITAKVFEDILEAVTKKRKGEKDVDVSYIFKVCKIRGK
ncbi:MAG: MFS transporter [Eubacteriales bacterium]